uniref:Protein kinase domain-containing protein n=1 Tax=Peronospora matthiolae TaxID=2874970 RepID=A0AAV1T6X7_9STRA
MVSLRDESTVSNSSTQRNTDTGDSPPVIEAPPASQSTRKTTKQSAPSDKDVDTTTATTGSLKTTDDTGATATTGTSRASDSTNLFKDTDLDGISSAVAPAAHNDHSMLSATAITTDNGVDSSASTAVTGDAVTGTSTVGTDRRANTNGSANRSRNTPNTVGSSAATTRDLPSPASARTSPSTVLTSSSVVQPQQGSSVDTANTESRTSTDLPVSSPSSTGTLTSGNTAADTTKTIKSANNHYNSGTTTATQGTATASSAGKHATSANGLTTLPSESTASVGSDQPNSGFTSSSTPSPVQSSEGFSSFTKSGAKAISPSSSRSSSRSSIALKRWYASISRENETQLIVGTNSSSPITSAFNQVCNGQPALITQSSAETPNGGCPDELTALNASCTCLTGYDSTTTSWVFNVMTETWNSTTTATTRSLTQSASDKLAVHTIRPIWVPSSLETLTIDGTGDSPAQLTFLDESSSLSSTSLNLVWSQSSNSSKLTTLSLTNLDLNAIAATKSDFIPDTVTNLTLRNCNISTLRSSFTHTWSGLQYLDLSLNNLRRDSFIGGAALKELNLSHNALAVFPVKALSLSALEALYIHGNNIKSFNVNQDEFNQIQALTAFTADQPALKSTCQDGAWQSAHGTDFCVLSASTAAVPDSSRAAGSTSQGDTEGIGSLAYWLVAGAVVVFFVLLLVVRKRRRYNRERDSGPFVSPIAIEPTTPKCDLSIAFDDALNRDSIFEAAAPAPVVGGGVASIAAQVYPGYGRSHGNSIDSKDTTAMDAALASNEALALCRLDYNDLQLGRCISRGGFGLVFVGSYRGRHVAVKKIRNERDVGCKQVEQFAREISLLSSLSHPRIVEFIGACWTTPAELSAVSELMERGDLRDVTRRFKRRGYRLTWSTYKVNIALHIAEALTYLHGLTPTVIHRDLKAKNVMLNADMEAKLSDFGVARKHSSNDGSEPMTAGIGTSFWIAPEVLLGHDYDERADIYSFGVVLSEIDTEDYPYWNAKHPPQGKAQENDILRQVARGTKRPTFADDCPPAILDLAARCLRTDPAKRPSALEIVLYLQHLLQYRNSSAPCSSMVRSSDGTKRSTSAVPAPDDAIMSSGDTDLAAPQKTTTPLTGTMVATSSDNLFCAASSRPRGVTYEMMPPSPQVTHRIHTETTVKGGRKLTTQLDAQASASSIPNHVTTAVSRGSKSVRSSRNCIDANPTGLQASHQATLNHLASNGSGALQAEKRP